jgi:hypothetical protein
VFPGPTGEFRQHRSLEEVEDGSVAVEAGNRHVAELVELLPFRGIALQVRAVLVEPWKAKLPEAAFDATTHLASNLPEAAPAHPHARERPLEECNAPGVPHPPSIVPERVRSWGARQWPRLAGAYGCSDQA